MDIIIIIIKLHGFPWLSLTIHPYHPSLLIVLFSCILCPHRTDVYKSLLVGQHWHVHKLVFIKECCLWVCLCFSSRIFSTCRDWQLKGRCNKKNDLPWNPKQARTCFACEVRKQTFLRVRVWFVEYRDALMQILASLDRDKKKQQCRCSWGSLVATRREQEETYGRTLFCHKDYQLSLRVRKDLQSDFVLLRSLPIKLVEEERITVRLVLFFFIW